MTTETESSQAKTLKAAATVTRVEDREVLTECLKRQTELAKADVTPARDAPVAEDNRRRSLIREQLDVGPAYTAAEWFAAHDDAIAIRYRRAVARLEKGGFIQTHRKWDRYITHIKLTSLGVATAGLINQGHV